ncbi:cyclic pyranopterin monophosphate synthase MoaC [Sphingomonas piscis]|uniref:Cyclic pyranopterin monophosphate synthase n=1 Tax=Sphingomonas piscis TaxID=2714943 RepID=A0A6G7YS08_9SPHN|nr:cyclic pyranopterin monophosphate synthase MoaC [Sphingomonas piscis]QIK79511.1 cyclic pyranopterin monophosphate synthase MoaC [Sphingomonas piscis]
MTDLTHLGADGRAAMVDVSGKAETVREARAEGRLHCAAPTVDAVLKGTAPKGAVISTAELAGIMAAKQTSTLIPLCHPLALSHVAVTIDPVREPSGFAIAATVRTRGPTGVEMEALTAVSVAGLTLFDMLKAIDRTITIDGVRVVAKSGGRSGDWTAA